MFKLSQIGIRKKILNDPYYRLQSLAEVAIAVELGIRIDVNQASVDDWLRLPGFSIHQARSLVDLVGMGVQLVCLEDVAAAINLPVSRLVPLQSILCFAYYDRLSVLSPEKINLNTASLEELNSLPNCDRAIAEEIIAERQNKGKYSNIVDLQRRLSLSNDVIAQIMYCIRF